VARKHDASHPSTFSTSKKGSQVPWISDAGTDQEKGRVASLVIDEVIQVNWLNGPGEGNHTLVDVSSGNGVQSCSRDQLQGHPSGLCQRFDFIELLGWVLTGGNEHLGHTSGVRREELANRPPTFNLVATEALVALSTKGSPFSTSSIAGTDCLTATLCR